MQNAPRTPQRNATRVFAALALVGTAALGACSDSSGLGSNATAQIGFTTTGSTAGASASLATVPVTVNGHTLDLDQVSVTISRVELKRAQTDACHGDDDDDVIVSGISATGATASNDRGKHDDHHPGRDSSCAEVRLGATTIDLPLDSNVVTIPANTIPPGTYREIELRIAFARLLGTFDTQPFDATLAVNVRAEIPFSTPLVVGEGTATSVTVNLPITDWLTNPDGSLVDPRQIVTNPALAAAVRNRIARSIRAFEDRDHDGRDDHDGHGHGHD